MGVEAAASAGGHLCLSAAAVSWRALISGLLRTTPPFPPLPSSALISMSLTHVHLHVSDMRLMLHVCTLEAL